MKGNQWTLWQIMPCQVRAHAKLALLCHDSMIEAAWFYPAHEVAETGQLHTCESLKMRLHVGHEIEWLFLFNGFPLTSALPQVLIELNPEFLPFPLWGGGVIEVEIGFHKIIQILLPTLTPMVS